MKKTLITLALIALILGSGCFGEKVDYEEEYNLLLERLSENKFCQFCEEKSGLDKAFYMIPCCEEPTEKETETLPLIEEGCSGIKIETGIHNSSTFKVWYGEKIGVEEWGPGESHFILPKYVEKIIIYDHTPENEMEQYGWYDWCFDNDNFKPLRILGKYYDLDEDIEIKKMFDGVTCYGFVEEVD